MAPLPPNATARFRFAYTCIGVQHTLQVRSAQSPATMGGFLNAYWTAFGSTLNALLVDFVTWAPAGSDIFNPVLTGIEGNTYGLGAGSTEQIPWAYTFIGRTPGGRRVRLNQYGAKTLALDYRTLSTENASIDAVITLLQGAGGNILGIDGLQPLFKSYANNQVNDHWIKSVRP